MTRDQAEFSAMYARHGAAVYRFAFYLCGDAAEAEEVAAETFARAWTSPSRIVNETVRAYLFTIARNVVTRRSTRASRDAPLPSELPDRSELHGRTEARDELRAVTQRLRELPEADRIAVLLRAEGSSYEEVGAALGTTAAAARVRVHRARAILMRARLGEAT